MLTLLFPCLISSQNTVCFTIEPNMNSSIAFSGFTKYVDVLGCFSVYAENSIPDSKVLHAAAIAAELLDNNEDGIIDDPLIEIQLQNEQAFMPIFAYEGSLAENLLFTHYNGNGASAVLYKNEMNPMQTGHWGDDATVEEVIHTINHVGHANVYPSAFDIQPNSSLMTTAMDVARGGQLLFPPWTYSSSAWYHYDDYTCDYECMAIEYMYWAIVSYMGVLDNLQTAAGIADEWEAYNASLLQSMDILMYNLITDPNYKLPLLAPDGNYCPNSTPILELAADRKLKKVLDLLGRETKHTNQPIFYIYDDGTVEKKIVIN